MPIAQLSATGLHTSGCDQVHVLVGQETKGILVTSALLSLSCMCHPQEDDVIGTLAADEKIGSLKPLGDRVLIKVGSTAKSRGYWRNKQTVVRGRGQQRSKLKSLWCAAVVCQGLVALTQLLLRQVAAVWSGGHSSSPVTAARAYLVHAQQRLLWP